MSLSEGKYTWTPNGHPHGFARACAYWDHVFERPPSPSSRANALVSPSKSKPKVPVPPVDSVRGFEGGSLGHRSVDTFSKLVVQIKSSLKTCRWVSTFCQNTSLMHIEPCASNLSVTATPRIAAAKDLCWSPLMDREPVEVRPVFAPAVFQSRWMGRRWADR